MHLENTSISASAPSSKRRPKVDLSSAFLHRRRWRFVTLARFIASQWASMSSRVTLKMYQVCLSVCAFSLFANGAVRFREVVAGRGSGLGGYCLRLITRFCVMLFEGFCCWVMVQGRRFDWWLLKLSNVRFALFAGARSIENVWRPITCTKLGSKPIPLVLYIKNHQNWKKLRKFYRYWYITISFI